MEIVCVDWWDTVVDSGQFSPEEAAQKEPLAVSSYGVVVKETNDVIILAQSITERGDYVDLITIPKAAVENIFHGAG